MNHISNKISVGDGDGGCVSRFWPRVPDCQIDSWTDCVGLRWPVQKTTEAEEAAEEQEEKCHCHAACRIPY